MKEQVTLGQVLFLGAISIAIPILLPFAIIAAIYHFSGKPL